MTRKDYRVHVKVLNNNLLTAIETHGFKSIPKFAKAYDLHYHQLLDLINMSLSPLKPDGELRHLTEQLMTVLGKSFDELFNERQVEGFETNRSETQVTAEGLYILTHATPYTGQLVEDVLLEDQSRHLVDEVLKTLRPRERDVIDKYFGITGPAMSQEEIGKLYDMSRGNVGVIIKHAMRKLRHPVRSEKLRPLLTDDFV